MASPPLSSNCTGSGAPCPAAPPTSWPTSTGPAPPTAPPKRSTADSNTSAAPPSASATSPTTSPDHSSKQAASAPPYTAKCDEPDCQTQADSIPKTTAGITTMRNTRVETAALCPQLRTAANQQSRPEPAPRSERLCADA